MNSIEKDLNTASDVIHWASEIERKYDISFQDRITLVDATIEFVKTVKPIYEKYKKGYKDNGKNNKM